jgi:hypothetical protein
MSPLPRKRLPRFPTITITRKPKPVITSSTYCSKKPVGRWIKSVIASSLSPACPTTRAMASSITCCGATMVNRWDWSKPNERGAVPAAPRYPPAAKPRQHLAADASPPSGPQTPNPSLIPRPVVPPADHPQQTRPAHNLSTVSKTICRIKSVQRSNEH